MTISRQQTIAIAAAALLVAVLGLALLAVLLSLRADVLLAQVASQSMNGQMQVSTVFETLSNNSSGYTYLSK